MWKVFVVVEIVFFCQSLSSVCTLYKLVSMILYSLVSTCLLLFNYLLALSTEVLTGSIVNSNEVVLGRAIR